MTGHPYRSPADDRRADGGPTPGAAAEAVGQVWEALGIPARRLGCGAWVVEGGALVAVDDEQTRVSCCMRRDLRATSELLAAVAQLNQSDPSGRYWLAESADGDDRWSLVWVATMPHAWTSAIHLQRAVHTCLAERLPWLREFASELTIFGGTKEPAPDGASWELLGQELWELTVGMPWTTPTTAWPAGSDPAGQQAGRRSAVEHDERRLEDLEEDHPGTSFPPPLPIPIRDHDGEGYPDDRSD